MTIESDLPEKHFTLQDIRRIRFKIADISLKPVGEEEWRSQGDLNPCRRRERAMS